MHYVSTDINPDLLSSIWDEEELNLGRHGPHIVVASEPTSELFLIHNMLKYHAYLRSH